MAVILHLARQQVGDLDPGGRTGAAVGGHQNVFNDLRRKRLVGRHQFLDTHIRRHHAVGDAGADGRLGRAIHAGAVGQRSRRRRCAHHCLERDGERRAGRQRAVGQQVGRRAQITAGIGGVGNRYAPRRARAASLRAGSAIGPAAAATGRGARGARAGCAATSVATIAPTRRRRGARGAGGVVTRRVGAGRRTAAAAIGAPRIRAIAADILNPANAVGRATRPASGSVLRHAAATARQHAGDAAQAEPRITAIIAGRAAGADRDGVVAAGLQIQHLAAIRPAAATATAAGGAARGATAAAAPRLHGSQRHVRRHREGARARIGGGDQLGRRHAEGHIDAVGNIGQPRRQQILEIDARLRHVAGVLEHNRVGVGHAAGQAFIGDAGGFAEGQPADNGHKTGVARGVVGARAQIEQLGKAGEGRSIAIHRIVAALVRQGVGVAVGRGKMQEVIARRQIGEGIGAGRGRGGDAHRVGGRVVQRDHHSRQAGFAAAALQAIAIDIAPDKIAHAGRRLVVAGIARGVVGAAAQREHGRAPGGRRNVAVQRIVAALVLQRGREILRRDKLQEVRARRQIGERISARHGGGGGQQQIGCAAIQPHRHAG